MKVLTFNLMESSVGARAELDWTDWVDGACTMWGTAYLFSILAHNPITGTFATGMDVFCGLWALNAIVQSR